MSLNCNLFSMNSAHTHTHHAKPPENKTKRNENRFTVQAVHFRLAMVNEHNLTCNKNTNIHFLFQTNFF